MCSNKKKRVLFVIGFTCPFPGAAWWRIFYFARHFEEKGHECYILSSVSPSTLDCPKVVRKENIYIYNVLPFIQLNNPFLIILNSIFASIASLPFFLLIRPTSVMISVPPVDQLLPVFLLSKIMRRKIVIDYRDEFEDHLIMQARKCAFFYRSLRKLLTYLYRNVAIVTPVTPAVAENLKLRGICNVKVICDGVDTKIFQPFIKSKARSDFGLPMESFVVAYLGNVYSPYRVDIVVRALEKLNKRIPKRKHLLLLIGAGDVKSVLNLACSLGIADSVKSFGVIKSPAQITRILSSADCGIIPYDDNPLWQRTYSTKLFEYCAIGLPVIATVHENSALATAIKVNNIGLVTPPINIDALTSSLESLSIDNESMTKMGFSAMKFARTYDREKLARDFFETVENCE